MGALRFKAPETFRTSFDARSEIYSLGLTLYELLTLRPAFDQWNRSLLVEQLTQANVLPLSSVNPDISSDLQTIVQNAIDADPARRYQSAQELADDLRRFLQDLPILARRTTLFGRLARWSRLNRAVAASLAVTLVFWKPMARATTAKQFDTIAWGRGAHRFPARCLSAN
ncbi:MAG: hypothetical protein ACKV0T_18290 [Planctomycetales bacterium]